MTTTNTPTLYGGIEGGGTKFVCVIGSGPNDIRAETRIDTTTPTETLDKVIALRVFSGIGWQWSSRNLLTRRRLVRHVDVRHASGHNPTGGTVLAPTVWQYGTR